MAVPVADALAHGVGAVEELHESDAALQQSASEQAVAGETGLGLVVVAGTVEAVRRAAFLGYISDFGRAQLHAGGQFITGDARGQFRVAWMACHMAVV